MFDNWGYVEWLILVIDIVAIVIVVRFLRNKTARGRVTAKSPNEKTQRISKAADYDNR